MKKYFFIYKFFQRKQQFYQKHNTNFISDEKLRKAQNPTKTQSSTTRIAEKHTNHETVSTVSTPPNNTDPTNTTQIIQKTNIPTPNRLEAKKTAALDRVKTATASSRLRPQCYTKASNRGSPVRLLPSWRWPVVDVYIPEQQTSKTVVVFPWWSVVFAPSFSGMRVTFFSLWRFYFFNGEKRLYKIFHWLVRMWGFFFIKAFEIFWQYVFY